MSNQNAVHYMYMLIVAVVFRLGSCALSHQNTEDRRNSFSVGKPFNSPEYNCMVIHGKILLDCYQPLMDMLDPDNAWGWKEAVTLNATIMFRFIDTADEIIAMNNYESLKVCYALGKWKKCMDYSQLSEYCHQFISVRFVSHSVHLLQNQCKHLGNLQQFINCFDAVKKRPLGKWRPALFKPSSREDIAATEKASNQRMMLKLFQRWYNYYITLAPIQTEADIDARIYCINLQLFSNFEKKFHSGVCSYLSDFNMTALVSELSPLDKQCEAQSVSLCQAYVKKYCELQPTIYRVKMLQDVSDISPFYNESSSDKYTEHFMKSSQELFMSSIARGKCNPTNLILKQMACSVQTFAALNLSLLLDADYFAKYVSNSITQMESCWDIYLQACPSTAPFLTYPIDFLRGFSQLLNYQPPVNKTACIMSTILFHQQKINGLIVLPGVYFETLFDFITRGQAIISTARVFLDPTIDDYDKDALKLDLKILMENDMWNTQIPDRSEMTVDVLNELCGPQAAKIYAKWVKNTESYYNFYSVLSDVYEIFLEM